MKTCAWCGGDYSKRPNEAHWQYAKRRYCSRPCADKGSARERHGERAADTIEDLTFLAAHGVGATEAAQRTGLISRGTLYTFLRRHEQGALLDRLAAQDYASVREQGPRRYLALGRAS